MHSTSVQVWGVFLLVVGVLLTGLAQCKNLYVSPDGDNSNPGDERFPFKTISFAVSVAQDGDEIRLESGTYNETETIKISSKQLSLVTASGVPDVLIKVPRTRQALFSLSSAKVSFDNLTLDGEGSLGTCVTIEASAVNLTGLSIHDCKSVALTATDSHVAVAACAFANNNVPISSSGSLTVNGSTFVGNSGAVQASAGIFNASDSAFANNTGGAITTSATTNLVGCSFVNNTGGGSGAVRCNANRMDVNGSTFVGNSAATGNGGAIFAHVYCHPLTVSGCRFAHNRVQSSALGGALYIYSTHARVSGSAFEHNHAQMGGGIYARQAEMTVTACSFTNNTAVYGGGGIAKSEGTMSVSESSFTGNVGLNVVGGGIFNSQGGTVTIAGSSFTGNTAPDGGAIGCETAQLTMSDSTFANNTAKNGGALLIFAGRTVVHNCVLSNNRASEDGGGAWFQNTFGNNWNACTFDCNQAGGQGDNYYGEKAPLNVLFNCTECTTIACPQKEQASATQVQPTDLKA